jgi:hypothetical protein
MNARKSWIATCGCIFIGMVLVQSCLGEHHADLPEKLISIPPPYSSFIVGTSSGSTSMSSLDWLPRYQIGTERVSNVALPYPTNPDHSYLSASGYIFTN